MKRESNIKKGRQKEQHNFRRTFPSRASLLSQTFQSFDNIYSATITKSTERPKALSFDTDSFELLVDNGASRSITNNKSDFIDTPRLVPTKIEGYSGVSKASFIGTVKWSIEDDQGRVHHITLPNTIYDAKSKRRILSPQHWSQSAHDHYPIKYGTLCATLDDQIVLMWDQRRYSKSIPNP
jgi:hypothetical protein